MALHASGAQSSCCHLAACVDLDAQCMLGSAQPCTAQDQQQFESLQLASGKGEIPLGSQQQVSQETGSVQSSGAGSQCVFKQTCGLGQYCL